MTFDKLGDRIDGADKESFTAADADADGFLDHGEWNHAKEGFGLGTRSGGTMGKTQQRVGAQDCGTIATLDTSRYI